MAKRSWRDDTTDILRAWGDMDLVLANTIVQDEDEDFQEVPGTVYWTGSAWAAYTPPDPPDPQAFLDALLEELGRGAANVLMRQYPLAFQALQIQPYNWTLFSELVVDAHDAEDIDDDFYNFIIAQAAVFDVPIELPALP